MAVARKTVDVWIIKANHRYGDGWEDETAETSYKEAKLRLKEYRENTPEGDYKIVKKRVKKEDFENGNF